MNLTKYEMKTLFLFASLLFAGVLVQAQNSGVLIFGHIYHNGTDKPVKGAYAVSTVNDSYTKAVVDKEGKFEMAIPYDRIVEISFKADGMVTKIVEVNTQNVPEKGRADGYGIDMDLFLFKTSDKCDLSVFEKPIGRSTYDAAADNFVFDSAYQTQVHDAVKKATSCLQENK